MSRSEHQSGMIQFITTAKSPLGEQRLQSVYEAALRLWHDQDAAAWFLDQPHPLLSGKTPREVALESAEGSVRVVRMIGQAEAGVDC